MSDKNSSPTRRTVLRSSLALTVGAIGVAAAGPVSAATDVVSPGESIQAAVDAADPGDVVVVEAGTYEETVRIEKDLTLRGEGKPTIKAPPGPVPFVDRFAPVVAAVGECDVTIEGFDVDGAGRAGEQSGSFGGRDSFEGILYYEASGTVKDNTVRRVRYDPLNGVQRGVGIYVSHAFDEELDHTVKVEDNEVYDYQKGGVVADEQGTVLEASNNEITGAGPTGVIAQNGIQVSFGATSELHKNTVSDHVYTGSQASASGIILFDSDDNDVKRCTLSGNEVNVFTGATYPDSYGTGGQSRFVRNTISGATPVDNYGFYVGAFFGDTADNNKIVNNDISDQSVGVYAFTEIGSSIANTKVIRNDFENCDTDIDLNGDTETKVQANR